MTFLNKRLRHGFIVIEERNDGFAYRSKSLGLVVISSVSKEADNKFWQHVSVSRKSRLPSYDDLKLVKSMFIGDDKEAYQVFVKESNHVNIHPYCLHLWSCLDGNVMPDFTQGSGSI